MAEKMGISRSKVQRMMKKLKEDGFIYRAGSKKTGYWAIAESVNLG